MHVGIVPVCWRSSVSIDTIETIGATIDAFGRGEIALPAVDPKTKDGHVHVAPGGATYTCSTIARFLGWTKKHGDQEPEPTRACRLAFDAYHEPMAVTARQTAHGRARIGAARRSRLDQGLGRPATRRALEGG